MRLTPHRNTDPKQEIKKFVTFHTKIPSRQISPRPVPALDRIIVAWRHHCVAWHYGHCSAIPRLLFITSIISSRLVQGFDFWILNYFLSLLGFDLSCWIWCPFDFKLIYELLISQTWIDLCSFITMVTFCCCYLIK